MKLKPKRNQYGEFATKHYVSRRQRIDELKGKVIAFVMVASLVVCTALGVVQIGKWGIHELHVGWERLVAHQVELRDRAWEIAMPQAMAYEEQESFPYVPEVLKSKEDYQWYLGTLVHGALYEEIVKVIDCETASTWDTEIQSAWKIHGKRERSYGLSQIHLPDHPEVSKEDAKDAKFALDFISKNYKAHKEWWSCARNLGFTK